MKMLDIFKNLTEDCGRFDEFMNLNGVWVKSNVMYENNKIVMLDYRSDNYNYFLFQGNSGHSILRNKK